MSNPSPPEPSGSRRSSGQQQPRPQPTSVLNQVPALKIYVPAKGSNSPRTSERCFSYCSQSVVGRTQGQEPWCRTLCIRRVFEHEVQQALDFHRDVGSAPQNTAQDTSHSVPLPPEAHTSLRSFLFDGDQPPDTSTSQHPPSPSPSSSSSNQTQNQPPARPQQHHWTPGLYIWLSRTRATTTEHLALMSSSLQQAQQHAQHKAAANDVWRAAVRAGQPTWVWVPAPGAAEQVNTGAPYPELLSPTTILLPVSGPHPREYVDAYAALLARSLAPTQRMLARLHKSFASGEQQALAGKVWEGGWARPVSLGRRGVEGMWKLWNKEDPPKGEGGEAGEGKKPKA